MLRSFALAVAAVLLLAGTSREAPAQGLMVLWVDPVAGPICAGPLGPGPCAVVAQWLATHPPPPMMAEPQMGGNPFGGAVPRVERRGGQRTRILPGDPIPNPSDIPPLEATVPVNGLDGALQCAQMTQQDRQPDVDSFLSCTRGAIVLDRDSMTLVNCAEQSDGSKDQLAECAARGVIAGKLSEDQIRTISCASENYDDRDNFLGCLGNEFIGRRLNTQQRAVLTCAAENSGDSSDFAICAGEALLGDNLSPEAQAAIGCAVESQGDIQQFGGCAVNKFLDLGLNPEQQIALECVVSSGGQPYVAAGCAASRLTARELEKCAQNGFGGSDGCFGDNNDLVGKNGFLVRNVAGLAGGPNSMVRDPLQVLGGPGSVFNNPRQVLGGPNSVPNQLLRGVPSPPPIEVGKIGNHRICIPWC
ncbi:hypothetical protein [Azospirillum picis]|uniref:Uncharacterized protein n=1 Tax=Azospirillum picis TaxID=488438 RepID=A0ABU0MRI1_9PROT|nr:hypothetical protein [Azospirillum picis]MBP2302452.1 hypothetical protein [Azospirillum picis]MDQ0536031.1 hypothetical protein [Azospirillum picis]